MKIHPWLVLWGFINTNMSKWKVLHDVAWTGRFFESSQPGWGLVRSEQGSFQSVLSSFCEHSTLSACVVCKNSPADSDCTWQPLSPVKRPQVGGTWKVPIQCQWAFLSSRNWIQGSICWSPTLCMSCAWQWNWEQDLQRSVKIVPAWRWSTEKSSEPINDI